MEVQSQNSGAMGVIMSLIWLAVAVLMIISMWKIFAKAGKPGWASIIPIYNLLVLLEIVGKPWWWLFLMIIPFVNFIFVIWTYNLLSKSFGHEEAFTIGILLLPIIFLPILAFGSSVYSGPASAEANRV